VTGSTGMVERHVRMAVSDPGAVTARRMNAGGELEPLPDWQARAVMTVISPYLAQQEPVPVNGRVPSVTGEGSMLAPAPKPPRGGVRVAPPGDVMLEPVRSGADPDGKMGEYARLLVRIRRTTPAARSVGIYIGRRLVTDGLARRVRYTYGVYLGALPEAVVSGPALLDDMREAMLAELTAAPSEGPQVKAMRNALMDGSRWAAARNEREAAR
jgi:hypothetical protein